MRKLSARRGRLATLCKRPISVSVSMRACRYRSTGTCKCMRPCQSEPHIIHPGNQAEHGQLPALLEAHPTLNVAGPFSLILLVCDRLQRQAILLVPVNGHADEGVKPRIV
eukprot:UN4933